MKIDFKKSEFEKSGIKLQWSTEEREQLFVQVIGRIKKHRHAKRARVIFL